MIVILYVMDSLRADFLSCYGSGRKTSPRIDALAEVGVLFQNSFVQSTWTRASAASLLTSAYPSVHRLRTLRDALPGTIPTLPERLKAMGFLTVGVSAMGNISPFFGFGRGFDRFVEVFKEPRVREKRTKVKFRSLKGELHFRSKEDEVPIVTSEDLHESLLSFLVENRGKDLFAFLWSLDTHDPYFHRDPGLARFASPTDRIFSAREVTEMTSEKERQNLRDLYSDMIYYNDHHLGLLVDRLKDLGLFEETFLILTGDHGESFGEHGMNSHGGPPYDEVIRVPLVMVFPRSQFQGRISELVQQIDIMPTVLDFVNGASGSPALSRLPGPAIQGKSLLPLLREKEPVNRFVFADTQLREDVPRALALRTQDYKFMEWRPGRFNREKPFEEVSRRLMWALSKPRSLFCLARDPEEQTNLIKTERATARAFRLDLETLLEENEKYSRQVKWEKAEKTPDDPEVAKQLQALGYFE